MGLFQLTTVYPNISFTESMLKTTLEWNTDENRNLGARFFVSRAVGSLGVFTAQLLDAIGEIAVAILITAQNLRPQSFKNTNLSQRVTSKTAGRHLLEAARHVVGAILAPGAGIIAPSRLLLPAMQYLGCAGGNAPGSKRAFFAAVGLVGLGLAVYSVGPTLLAQKVATLLPIATGFVWPRVTPFALSPKAGLIGTVALAGLACLARYRRSSPRTSEPTLPNTKPKPDTNTTEVSGVRTYINPRMLLKGFHVHNLAFVEIVEQGEPRDVLVMGTPGQWQILEDTQVLSRVDLASFLNGRIDKKTKSLIKYLLEKNPSSVRQITEGGLKCSFIKYLCQFDRIDLDLITSTILPTLKSQLAVISNDSIEWIIKSIEGDCAFSADSFNGLDNNIKEIAFYVANLFHKHEFVEKLRNECGFNVSEKFPEPHQLFTHTMDTIEVRMAVEKHLRSLKSRGLLLFKSNFAKTRHLYMEKFEIEAQIHRLQGRDWVKSNIETLQSQHIKVPKKVVVIDDSSGNSFFRIRLDWFKLLAPAQNELGAGEACVRFYAELKTPIQRLISYEEAIELLSLCVATGYRDVRAINFIVAEDGIYFIDTELNDFSPGNLTDVHWRNFNNIRAMMDPGKNKANVDRFNQEYARKRQEYVDAHPTVETQSSKGPMHQLSLAWAPHHPDPLTFAFQMDLTPRR